jgi:hypothetical protein
MSDDPNRFIKQLYADMAKALDVENQAFQALSEALCKAECVDECREAFSVFAAVRLGHIQAFSDMMSTQ